MRPSSGSRNVWLALALILAACSGKSDNGQGNVPSVDGGVVRSMANRDAAPDGSADRRLATVDGAGSAVADVAQDTGVDAPVSAKDGAGDGAGDASVSTPAIKVEVDYQSLVPSRDGGVVDPLIVPSSYSPSPLVTVTVVSNTGDLKADEISTLTVDVFDPLVSKPKSTTTLAKSESTITPESNTMRFIFSGVPLNLSDLSTGSYTLVFTATTVGGATGQARVVLSVDAGPNIVVKLPAQKAFYKGSAPVEVQATQDKFAITEVTMALGQGQPTRLTSVGAGTYKGNIDFAAFVPPLEGEQAATFRAFNENGTSTTVVRTFISDNTGPTIKDTQPSLGKMIGRVISISATIEDGAGVDATSVIAVIANGDQNFEVPLVQQGTTNQYASLFDTTKLPSYALYPSISFRARDRLGNESTTSYLLSLDNEPPVMDLDPPYLRAYKEDKGRTVCSWPFDPVGPDAVDDLDTVTQLFDVRARIEDRGNSPLTGEADFVLIGGVDTKQVKLYVLDSTSRPLVVDTSNPPDGICDDINPDLIPTSRPQTELDAQVLDMEPLSPTGAPDYSVQPGVSCSSTAPAERADPFCGTTMNIAKPSESMSFVMSYSDKKPSIYSLGPVVKDDLQCAGRQFDASNNLKNGWACLAVKAQDTLGNAQVSRPIRVCVVATPSETDCKDVLPLARMIPADPLEIVSSKPILAAGAALVEGDEVIINGVRSDAFANGRWKVKPLDATGTYFALIGATGRSPSMCVCADSECKTTSSCPKTALRLQLTPGQPIIVETATPHGFSAETPTFIILSGNTEQSGVAGLPWAINVVDSTHFTLANSVAQLPLGPGGRVVAAAVVPDCTGTLIKAGTDGGVATVDPTKQCKSRTEQRGFEKR